MGSLSAGKVAALKAVGVEFDGRKAQAIREQHEAMRSGKGKEDTDGQDEEGGPSAGKVAALKPVGVEFDGRKAKAIRSHSSFQARLEELKVYKRQHGEMLHVAPSHSQCVDREVRSLATISTAFGNPDARL